MNRRNFLRLSITGTSALAFGKAPLANAYVNMSSLLEKTITWKSITNKPEGFPKGDKGDKGIEDYFNPHSIRKCHVGLG